nr:exodeoxyribonuclease V subunit alpha [Kofleriaceae bacterium]
MTLPLHPRGTLRTWFETDRGGGAADEVFRRLRVGARQCDLGDEGLYLAEELVSADHWLGGGDPEALAILVLALMIAQRQGSTRLPLATGARAPLRTLVADIARVAGLGAEVDVPRVMKQIDALTRAPGFDAMIGAGDARRPLIVDDGCIYTERARRLEVRVAKRLAARLVAPPMAADRVAAAVAEIVARPGRVALGDEQIAAVTAALGAPLAVVTGGPGTGKTLVAASLVRGLARLGFGPIALAAQTGKAANRLTTVIADQLAAVRERDEIDTVLAAAPPVAQTLHRLLGYRDERFAHHARAPLPVGALIIDEASMIDLELADAVLDALPAHAPLILIGDPDQLPAIAPGQILADLVASAPQRTSRLSHSHRMEHGRSILDAAAAVRDGAAGKLATTPALATPRSPGTLTFRGVEWIDSAVHEPIRVAEELWHHFDGARALRLADRTFRFTPRIADADRAALDELWDALARARILAVTRGQDTGSLAINAHLHARSLDRLTLGGRPEFVPGEPVMITANDYERGLFNGDQGIVVRADEGHGTQRFRAVFRVGGELVPFAIEALRDRLELAWALTVHKAQGSELDAVAVILPAEDLPLVTRELVYTAITRARTGVAIAGSRGVLAAAGRRGALRDSGLGKRIAGAILEP